MGESLDEGGYLGRILNAKVYDVAVETELQHAKNLSVVSVSFFRPHDITIVAFVFVQS